MSVIALLADPFGPYKDRIVLSDKCKSTPTRLVTIRDLRLSRDGVDIGLDETESQPEPEIAIRPIRFSGVVEIKLLQWLTPESREVIEADIRNRDEEKRGQLGYVPVRNLTLARLYNTGKEDAPKIKLGIEGRKSMSVSYRTSDLVQAGMAFTSEHKNRLYEVKSLHQVTHGYSLNFIARYRLLALMRNIVDTDDLHTPLEERTIGYFIDSYINRYANDRDHPLNLHNVKELDSEDIVHDDEPPHSRHEVRGIFAGQSEWILAEQHAMRNQDKRTISLRHWRSFCIHVRKDRRAARCRGEQWGLPYGDVTEADFDDEIDMTRYRILGRTKEQVREALSTKSKGRTSERHANLLSPAPFQDDDDDNHSYDSDFSIPSTPSATDSDSAPEDVDPELIARIPRCMWFPPQLPDVDFKWYCPVSSCDYIIDMLNLTTSNTHRLPNGEARFLRSKAWSSVRDERVMENFHAMVSRHYENHLSKIGIRLPYQNNNKVVPQWIHPKQHRPWPPKPVDLDTN